VQQIQRRINVATMYVTHDQVEAMMMGDRVAVKVGERARFAINAAGMQFFDPQTEPAIW